MLATKRNLCFEAKFYFLGILCFVEYLSVVGFKTKNKSMSGFSVFTFCVLRKHAKTEKALFFS